MPFSVHVDDTNPGIVYTGKWYSYPYVSNMDGWGTYGPTWNGTIHSIASSGSLAYTFQGMLHIKPKNR